MDSAAPRSLEASEPRALRTSRRQTIVGAAWATPAIVLASAAPAYAFSGDTTVVLGMLSATRADFVSGTPYYRWSGGASGYGLKTTNGGVPTATVQTNSVLNLSIGGISTAGGGGTGAVTMVVTVPSNDTDSNRAAAQYGSIGAGWTLSGGAPSINTTTRFTTWTFVSATVAVGDALPDLTFSVTNSSNTGASVYTWNLGLTVSASATASDSSAPATIASTSTA